ncbi:MAG: excinuclease ABC subunit A, partial [Verrucomicrobia bacterium]|nr:excinuclease ABC subunit A [Verrucomicrobiota bacterium]
MSKAKPAACIRLRGVRHNNLKNFDLDLPLKQLIVITGLSGSGKSSLAFDTLFAEGQRRYIETFSPYARQFFDRMDKPQVDRIEGIPPAIAIEQRNSVKTTRSTVGTMTEICEHMKVLWPHIAQLYCRQCGQIVRKDSPQQIWQTIGERMGGTEALVMFALPLSEKISLNESLALIARQGYQRLFFGDEIVRLDDAGRRLSESKPAQLTIVQDRLKLADSSRARFIEACEQAYHFGQGRLAIRSLKPTGAGAASSPTASLLFSNRFHCAACDLEYREPTSALFSFNNPVGACPTCRGFGRTITIDYDLAIPDRSKTLAGGAIKPWQVGHGLESQSDLTTFCKKRKVPMNVPFERLPSATQAWVIDGDPGYGSDAAHQWPRAWYGVKGYFRWLESKSYKMHVRVLLARYRTYQTCPDCHGKRFQPEALLFRVERPELNLAQAGDPKISPGTISLADFYQMSVRDALRFIEAHSAKLPPRANDPHGFVLSELRARLGYLVEVGLGYLTLDRPTRSLSGGETERVNLTTCLGTRLVNTLFVLDEPSVGLHPRDTARLIRILERLRDTGNTVVVVEHEASVMRAADQILDLGPGQGEAGGRIVFQGSPAEILKSAASLTGQYLSGRKQFEIPRRRPVLLNSSTVPVGGDGTGPKLILSHATRHNLRDVTVAIPLQR